MSPISEKDRAKIKNVFDKINNLKFSTLKDNDELFKNLLAIAKYFSKDTYENEVELEKEISAFNQVLLQAWEKLYLYKFLNEFDLTDSSSMATLLFQNLSGLLVNGTDASECCRRDTLRYRNGKIIE